MERYDPKRLELSTRDVVARAIYTEVKEGRGTPHGGVFLDVSHLGAATVTQKLPSMYDQFMELAGVDITREPMEVGPTCHYIMGGIRVDAETGASTRRRPVRRRRVLGRDERRQPARRQLALRPARVRQARRRGRGASYAAARRRRGSTTRRSTDAAAEMTRLPVRRRATRTRTRCTRSCRTTMQDDVGIFRDEAGLTPPSAGIDGAAAARRAARARRRAARAFNPGWHLCRDLRNMLIVSPRPSRAPRCCASESRGAHSRLDFPRLRRLLGRAQHRRAQGRRGGMAVEPRPVVKTAAARGAGRRRARRPSDA